MKFLLSTRFSAKKKAGILSTMTTIALVAAVCFGILDGVPAAQAESKFSGAFKSILKATPQEDLGPIPSAELANCIDVSSESVNAVRPGQLIRVTLSENQTTPYRWVYALSDSDLLEFVYDKYKMDPNPRQYDGVGGKHTYYFRALRAGEGSIEMYLFRIGEEQDQPDQAEVFIILIEDAWRDDEKLGKKPPANEGKTLNESTLTGTWHASGAVGAVFSERYAFYDDGTFLYGCSEFDKLERVRYKRGDWELADGILTLTVYERMVLTGGHAVEDPVFGQALEDTETWVMWLTPYVEETYTVAQADAEPGMWRATITIGDTVFYRYDDESGIMDGYDEMCAQAAGESEIVFWDGFEIQYSGDFAYILRDGQATIVGHRYGLDELPFPDKIIPYDHEEIDGYDDDCCLGYTLVIPSRLDGYPVIAIGAEAFYECCFSEVIMPDGITSIGDWAFGLCYYFSGTAIPDSVTFIGRNAFDCCDELESVKLPSGITYLSDGLFNECASLTGVNLPEGIVTIGHDAFNSCSSLTSLIVPSSVVAIGNSAFESCVNLTSLVIPRSVVLIGYDAFYGCENLTLTVAEGSYAASYAEDNEIPYVYSME